MKPYERRCVVCGKPESEVGLLSTRGLCEADGAMLTELNAQQIRDRSGPFYEHWAARRYLAAKRRIVEIERRRAASDGAVIPER